MPLRLVAEEVADTLQFHQAADKVEAALLILYAVVPDAIAAGQLVFDIDLVFRKQRFDDLRYRLPLENTQVTVTLHWP